MVSTRVPWLLAVLFVVVGAPSRGFTDRDVAQLGHDIAIAMASKYRPRAGPSIDLVSLEDESGWLVNMRDVIKHSHLLYPIVKRYPSFVPGIMLIMLCLLNADTFLEGKMLRDTDRETEAYKYPRTLLVMSKCNRI